MHPELVLGDGPFAQVGLPRAVSESEHFVAVGGSLGWPQWNGRSVRDRSHRRAGWEPVAVYARKDLVCRAFLTSRWPVNSIAIHPNQRVVAIGTGCYDGGYSFEGELLIHDLDRGTTRSVLRSERSVERVAWLDEQTLEVTMPPPTDEDLDWPKVPYESVRLTSPDWGALEDRSVDLSQADPRSAPTPEPFDSASLERRLMHLAAAARRVWQRRRQAWAVSADAAGVLVGLEDALERWTSSGDITWRRSIPRHVVTQILPLS